MWLEWCHAGLRNRSQFIPFAILSASSLVMPVIWALSVHITVKRAGLKK